MTTRSERFQIQIKELTEKLERFRDRFTETTRRTNVAIEAFGLSMTPVGRALVREELRREREAIRRRG